MTDNQIYSLPNILIIDDVNTNLVVLTEIIRNAGYIARPVSSARQAVNAIEALPPSLILMDISMPEIDGIVFCSMLKSNVITRDIPVIFISALNTGEDRIRGLKAGAVDYISKPYEVDEVILRINMQLQIYRKKQEMENYNKRCFAIINNQINLLKDEQKLVVNSMAKVILRKDSSKEKHLDCVAKNSRILAMSLQMAQKYLSEISSSFIDAIELAAPIHDVGNVILNYGIVRKKNNLSPEEIEIVRSHTTVGAELLQEIYSMDRQNEYIKMAMEIAANHHEHWNGSGYPAGIRGTDIPLSARIVAIVHEYDRLIHDVGNGKALSPEESVRAIINCAGSLFDPDIVSVFNKIRHQLKC